MVKIRLRRVGAKKQPSYRVVVADSRAPRDGRFIEVIGFYNPRTEPETVRIEEERALYWLGVGAQPTEAARRLLKGQGTLDRFERLKSGVSMEALVAEAQEAAQAASEISPKTRMDLAASDEEEPAEEPEPVEEPEAAEPEEDSAEETETEENEEEDIAETVEESEGVEPEEE
jgi:small subunit ribosomal protein S16